MSDSDHYAHCIKRLTDNLAYELRSVGGYFDKLEGRLADGVWSREFDMTASSLGSAEAELRTLANEISNLRKQFLQNVPLVAAE